MTAGDPIARELPIPIEAATRPPMARLRLVEGHEHTWRLRSIDFSDGDAVREFGCGSCDSVWFD